MTTAIPTYPTSEALRGRLEEGSGLLVGDCRKPDGGGWQGAAGASQFVAYLVLHPMNTLRNGPDAPISDRGLHPQGHYQVTAVGADRRQAEAAADLAAGALVAKGLSIDGRTVVFLIHETSMGVEVDESVNPPVFTAVDRYRIDLN